MDESCVCSEPSKELAQTGSAEPLKPTKVTFLRPRHRGTRRAQSSPLPRDRPWGGRDDVVGLVTHASEEQ